MSLSNFATMQSIIRRTRIRDLDIVMSIYDYARTRMQTSGNPNQWIDGYPSCEIIIADIQQGNSFVIETENKITGVFTFIIGPDPTYEVIEGGWLNDNPYGTIHRIAAAPNAKGIADICLNFCKSKELDIRVDTHPDNIPMLNWIKSRSFTYCGIIYCHNGSRRKAFQLPK